jgi:cytochrome d ubiquinol oxidase subunit II
MDLNIVWFILIGFLLVGYAILDGFDLGVGMLQFFVRTEADKNKLRESIAPFWDGNEVWLLTGAGAIFAAFPHVYATVFSGFYIAMMLLLVGLIFRALSIEFRNQVDSQTWKNFWDKAFSISSLIVALLLGVALGNIFIGIPLDGEMNFTGSFFTLLRPVPLLVGVTSVFMISLQGAAFLLLKTDKDLYRSAQSWVRKSLLFFILLTALLTITTAITNFSKIEILYSNFWGYLAAVLVLVSAVLVPHFLKKEANFKVFLSTSVIIAGMFLIVAATIFPDLVPAHIPEYSLDIYNAASSQRTLFVMLIIALIGMPIVLVYTTFIYRVFRK